MSQKITTVELLHACVSVVIKMKMLSYAYLVLAYLLDL